MCGAPRTPGYVADVGELRAFARAGLSAAPPAAGVAEESVALDAQLHLAEVALDLAADGGPDLAGESAIPSDLARWAVEEVLGATAACEAQEQLGSDHVDLDAAVDTGLRVAAFVREHGLGPLVRAYGAVATHDDLRAVSFYQPMPERAFITGGWHRPWCTAPLQDELLMAAAAGLVRLRRSPDGVGRELLITAEGHSVLEAVTERMEAAGILTERRAHLALSHRNALARHPAAPFRAAPALHAAWAELLRESGLQAGDRVLLLGVAVGGAELVRAAAERVGPGGAVTVVDPAVALLRLFAGTGLRPPEGAAVRFVPGRFDALPLSDAAADACLAPGFLRLWADGRALGEVRRVVRPGGRVALAVPHAVDLGHALLRGCMEPLLGVTGHLGLPEPGAVHAPGEAAEWLRRSGFVDVRARSRAVPVPAHPHALVHLLHGGTGSGLLERLPWRARTELLRELGARAAHLLDAAAPGHLEAPGEVLLATVP